MFDEKRQSYLILPIIFFITTYIYFPIYICI